MDASDRKKRAGSEAADWFARLQSGEMERAEREQFVEWLRESHLHVAEMLRIAQVHGTLERFNRWAHIATGPKTADDNVVQLLATPEEDLHDASSHSQKLPSRRVRGDRRDLRLFAAAAAVVAVMITIAGVMPKIRGQVIETDRGERREVVLSDGSIMQVDPESRLRVKYAAALRLVLLERGRALFRVAKNKDRPFVVEADDTTVRAVGTAFGVEQQAHGVVVTVAEGKVAVLPTALGTTPAMPQNMDVPGSAAGEASYADHHAADGSARRLAEPKLRRLAVAGGKPAEVFLTANQQVTVESSGPAEPVREVDSQRALAWAQGRLIFQNEELGKIVTEFNRYNHLQLSVSDPVLAAKPVSGVFNAAEPEAFIAFLQSVTSLQIVRDGERGITIDPARTH